MNMFVSVCCEDVCEVRDAVAKPAFGDPLSGFVIISFTSFQKAESVAGGKISGEPFRGCIMTLSDQA
jgi:hypothetical protein